MSIGWSDLTPAGERYFAELEKLTKLEVQVGFQDGEVAEIAAYNELGTSSIPARPFMRQSFENHGGELQAACDQVNETLNGGGSCESALEELGVFVKGLMQNEIVSGGFEPNSPVTVARKGSDTPLIDTGHMRQSVNYVVKGRG